MPGADQSWRDDYRRKVTTAEQAVGVIKSGDSVYVHSNAAVPQPLIDALVGRAGELRGVTIRHLLTLGQARYAQPEYQASFAVNALFIGPNVREAVNAGRVSYTPAFLSEIPALLLEGRLPVDVCLMQVSPPDEHGFCSLGVSVDVTIAARKSARSVIAEVNQRMPRTLGRSFVHISRIDHLVETDRPLSQNYKMTSINSALQIDLSGQVASDSIGLRLYSGFGGQVDFIRGSVRSKGGKAIIALPSTAERGTVSRIVPVLDRGSGVVTSRADVHYVVTEHGIADFYGKDLLRRARALIAVAHPDFRAQLEREFFAFTRGAALGPNQGRVLGIALAVTADPRTPHAHVGAFYRRPGNPMRELFPLRLTRMGRKCMVEHLPVNVLTMGRQVQPHRSGKVTIGCKRHPGCINFWVAN